MLVYGRGKQAHKSDRRVLRILGGQPRKGLSFMTLSAAIKQAQEANRRTRKAYFVVRESCGFEDYGVLSVQAYQEDTGGTAYLGPDDIKALVDSVGVERY